jgi:hypothetical protein
MTRMRTAFVTGTALLLGASLAIAAPPARNVNPHKHPNIAEAQQHCRMAYEKVVAAQKANEWDMGGHAQKAKDLLDQASNELKAAAEEANEHQ